jgi:hypothetical protein
MQHPSREELRRDLELALARGRVRAEERAKSDPWTQPPKKRYEPRRSRDPNIPTSRRSRATN